MKILSEASLRALVPLDLSAVRCIEYAFLALSNQDVLMPPVLRLDIAKFKGEVDIKTAYVPSLDNFAIKISSGFFSNPVLGLPSTSGMMVVLSASNGLVEAVLLDNGYLTDVRTAAAGAVAAQYLSRKDASVVTVLGAGMQARFQLRALTLVRPVREARIWARDESKAKALADELSLELRIPVAAFQKPWDATSGSHIIVTTTPSCEPILQAQWLEPGQHVTAMGSDAEYKNEIAPAALACADLYAADSASQTRKIGELHHALVAGSIEDRPDFCELGEVIAGSRPGRQDDSQITIADLTGTGVQDTAIANLALSRALQTAPGEGKESWT
ncbi:cyclodeaminase [Mesorhizobium sp. M0923]|uniref:cyclodeaminase n=1 Tax=Mesorhizobium sp. M0923 TaxID=2957028 RepID=UPI00333B075D